MTDEPRRLVAVVHIGIAARGQMIAVDEPLALAMIKVRQPAIEAAANRHDGYQVQSGRGLIVLEFQSAVSAAMAAIEIQHEMNRRNAAGNDLQSVRLQIGIDLLDLPDTAMQTSQRVARLQLQSPIGGIALSDPVYQVVRSHLDVRLLSLGMDELEPGRGLANIWQVDLGEGTTLNPTAPNLPVSEVPQAAAPLRPSGSFFANAMRGMGRGQAGRATGSSSGPSFEIETFVSGNWELMEVLHNLGEARNAAKDRAKDKKTKVRLMEVVWAPDGRSSQNRLVAEFNGGSAGAQAATYDIESNVSGAWMCVGNFKSQDEATTAAKDEANAGRCKVKVIETTFDEVSRTYVNKLIQQFNGALLEEKPKYVPTDSAGRRLL